MNERNETKRNDDDDDDRINQKKYIFVSDRRSYQ